MNEDLWFLIIKKVLRRKLFLTCIEPINFLLRKIGSITHAWQLRLEWVSPVPPEWFNHFYDQYWQWHAKRNPLWIERGCFNLLAINQGASVLELCCGDGFNSYHFYSIRAKKIIAVDFGREAIAYAKKYNQAQNIKYKIADIRKYLPDDKFDNIVWDGAIEHFTIDEITRLVPRIKSVLNNNGVLSGYTALEEKTRGKMHSLHEYEFKTREDLGRFFTSHFKHVIVFETDYPSRKNLYFFASDGILPFGKNWKWLTVND